MGLVFHCRLCVLLFLLVATALIIAFPIFSTFFTYAYIGPARFVKCSSLSVFSLR